MHLSGVSEGEGRGGLQGNEDVVGVDVHVSDLSQSASSCNGSGGVGGNRSLRWRRNRSIRSGSGRYSRGILSANSGCS